VLLNDIGDLLQGGTVLVRKDQYIFLKGIFRAGSKHVTENNITTQDFHPQDFFFKCSRAKTPRAKLMTMDFFLFQTKKLIKSIASQQTFSNAIQLVYKQKVSLMLKTLMSWYRRRGLLTTLRAFYEPIDNVCSTNRLFILPNFRGCT
jgi:hypothetical protein